MDRSTYLNISFHCHLHYIVSTRNEVSLLDHFFIISQFPSILFCPSYSPSLYIFNALSLFLPFILPYFHLSEPLLFESFIPSLLCPSLIPIFLISAFPFQTLLLFLPLRSFPPCFPFPQFVSISLVPSFVSSRLPFFHPSLILTPSPTLSLCFLSPPPSYSLSLNLAYPIAFLSHIRSVPLSLPPFFHSHRHNISHRNGVPLEGDGNCRDGSDDNGIRSSFSNTSSRKAR